ncbi:MAG TPA: DsbA family protein, partial [Kofleriaceae bacterium]
GHAPRLIWGQDRIPFVEAALAGWDFEGPPPGGARPYGRDVTPFVSPHSLECYFDIASPYAYLALTQLEALAKTTGTQPVMKPILLGGLFREIGQADVPLFRFSPAKQRYVGAEIHHFARWFGVPFAFATKFPQRSIAAQRLIHVARAEERLPLALALGRAMWAEQRDIEDLATLRAVVAECGLPASYPDRIADAEIKAALIAAGAEAKARGIFGVPTFIIGGRHLVWGVDRLDLVTRFAAGWHA